MTAYRTKFALFQDFDSITNFAVCGFGLDGPVGMVDAILPEVGVCRIDVSCCLLFANVICQIWNNYSNPNPNLHWWRRCWTWDKGGRTKGAEQEREEITRNIRIVFFLQKISWFCPSPTTPQVHRVHFCAAHTFIQTLADQRKIWPKKKYCNQHEHDSSNAVHLTSNLVRLTITFGFGLCFLCNVWMLEN